MEKGYEDMHLTLNLLTIGKTIATIPVPLVLYRTKTNSMWQDAYKNHHEELMTQIKRDFPTYA